MMGLAGCNRIINYGTSVLLDTEYSINTITICLSYNKTNKMANMYMKGAQDH